MSEYAFHELFERLRVGDESVEIEAKPGHAITKAVLQTVSAFANEPGRGGGYVLLGVEEDQAALFGGVFVVAGDPHPGKLQSDLATQCRNDLQPPVRPRIAVEQYEDQTVLVAFVPEAAPGDKPVYIKAEGLPRGAYRRIGSTDQHCTDDDLAVLYQDRAVTTYDASPVEGSTVTDIDHAALTEYREQRSRLKPDAAELRFDDPELLYALGATTTSQGAACLTVAGMMLFAKEASLRRLFPMARVDYIRVEGRDWVPDPEKRYSAVDARGPLMTLVPRVVSQVLDDIPKAFSLSGNEIHRRDVPLVPRAVIREAVVNALMHRSYRTASPVQIIRYSNRIEIHNPGASLVAEDRLGEPGSFPRNEKIAAVLHEVGLAETKGTGIRAMRLAMHQANLTPPLFESDRQKDEFRVMLLVHHLFGPEDTAWLARLKELSLTAEEARALVVIREAGAITNAMYRDINSVDTLTASGSLRRLRDAGLLEQKGKGRATYYLPTPHLVGPGLAAPPHGIRARQPEGLPPSPAGIAALPDGFQAQPERSAAQPEGLLEQAEGFIVENLVMPPALAQAIADLGGRPDPARVRTVILDLCAWRALSGAELAKALGRSTDYLRNTYLSPMVAEGLLKHTHPGIPAHPQQKYVRVEPD